MRTSALVSRLLTCASCASCAIVLGLTRADDAHAQPRAPEPARAARPDDLARARALDKEGAKAYGDGRYNDAIRYFEEAHRLGGPPFELWNIAKCHVRLDQPEQAAEMLERYLATPTLPPEDREEATQQLDGLRKRPSTLTVSTMPQGATVSVDGQPGASRSPMSTTIAPGRHFITITHPSYAPYTREVDARYGRAILIAATLAQDRRPPPPVNPYGGASSGDDDAIKRLSMRAATGIVLPRFGGVGGGAQIGFTLSGIVRAVDVGRTAFGFGALVFLTPDSWSNTVNAPTAAFPCGELSKPNSALAITGYAAGTAGWELTPKLRAHGMFGLGVAGYSAGDIGGDVFFPTCSASSSPGVRPSFLFGSQLDYAVTSAFRLSAMPLALQLQPAFSGARLTPEDASGVWLRVSFMIGAGVDL